MKSRYVAAIAGLIVSAGVALAQLPESPPETEGPAEQAARSAVAVPAASDLVPSVPAGPESVADGAAAPSSGVWARADYMLWFLAASQLPAPVVKTGDVFRVGDMNRPPPALTAADVPLGHEEFRFGPFSGARVLGGYWLEDDQRLGLEAGGFFLAQRSVSRGVHSDASGNPGLYRPLFDTYFVPNQFTGLALSNPGRVDPDVFSGGLSVTASARMWGCEADVVSRCRCPCSGCVRLYKFAGLRYMNLREQMDFFEDQFDPAGVLAFNGAQAELPGTTRYVLDTFQTHNNLYAAEIGARAEVTLGSWFVHLTGKVAVGWNHQEIDIEGASTQVQLGLPPVTVPGGFLAVKSNIGHFERDEFSAVPEGEARFGYRVTENLRAHVAYDILYWSNVVRPGPQLGLEVGSRTIDQRQVPTSPFYQPHAPAEEPRVLFKHTWDFYAQGVDFGVEWTY